MDKHNLWDMVENGHIHLEIPRGCMDYPRREDWPTTYSRSHFSPTDITSVFILRTCGATSEILVCFILWDDAFGVKYEKKEDVEHLMGVLKPHYEMTNNWEGKIY